MKQNYLNYQGVNLPENIYIVEKRWAKKDRISAGYVVIPGNYESLGNACKWASSKLTGRWENGSFIFDEIITPGVCHTYANGHFKLTINKAGTRNPYTGSISSDWSCILEAPDNKKFDIDIDAESLCETIKYNTLEDGVVSGNIWLGRKKGNKVIAVTEKQPMYMQSLADGANRVAKKTEAYDKVGQVLTTLNNKNQIYAGKFYKLFDIRLPITLINSPYSANNPGATEIEIKLLEKPKTVYGYMDYHSDEYLASFARIDIYSNKLKRIVTDRVFTDISPEYLYQQAKELAWKFDTTFTSGIRRLNSYESPRYCGPMSNTLTVLRYSDDPNKKITADEIIEIFSNDYVYHNYKNLVIRVVSSDGQILNQLTSGWLN